MAEAPDKEAALSQVQGQLRQALEVIKRGAFQHALCAAILVAGSSGARPPRAARADKDIKQAAQQRILALQEELKQALAATSGPQACCGCHVVAALNALRRSRRRTRPPPPAAMTLPGRQGGASRSHGPSVLTVCAGRHSSPRWQVSRIRWRRSRQRLMLPRI
jgi:hypothetical protein